MRRDRLDGAKTLLPLAEASIQHAPQTRARLPDHAHRNLSGPLLPHTPTLAPFICVAAASRELWHCVCDL